MKRAILTGFEPFGPYSFNPVQDTAREYDGKIVDDVEVLGLVLPCTYYGSFDALSENMNRFSPDIILSTGLASRVPRIRFESIGRNVMDGKYPDANGSKPDYEPIVPDGRPWYPTNSDFRALVNALRKNGIPAEISIDAEGFICNSLLYLTARRIHEEELAVGYAFFHTPWTDDYLDRIKLEHGKVTIKKCDLRKAIEVTLHELTR